MSPRRGRTGTVLRVRFVVLAVARVRRASWEITRPAVDFSFVASSLAAWRTSSSISIVVRMHLMLSHRLVMSNPVYAFVFLLCQFFCYRTAVLLETKNSSGADTISLEEIRRHFPALARAHTHWLRHWHDRPVEITGDDEGAEKHEAAQGHPILRAKAAVDRKEH